MLMIVRASHDVNIFRSVGDIRRKRECVGIVNRRNHFVIMFTI